MSGELAAEMERLLDDPQETLGEARCQQAGEHEPHAFLGDFLGHWVCDGAGDHGPGCDGPLNCTCEPEVSS